MLIHPIVYCTVALMSLSPAPHADELADHFVFEQGSSLCGRIGADGPIETLSDNAHFLKAEHEGICSYVILRSDDRRSWLTIMECDSAGNLHKVRTLLDEKLNDATAILDASFLPGGRLFVVLHINPSLDVAVAIDPQTSERLVMLGNTFTCDKSGRHIAYLLEPASSTEASPTEIWMDGRKICDAPRTQGGDLQWDDTGTHLTGTFAEPGAKEVKLVIRVTDSVTVAQTTE